MLCRWQLREQATGNLARFVVFLQVGIDEEKVESELDVVGLSLDGCELSDCDCGGLPSCVGASSSGSDHGSGSSTISGTIGSSYSSGDGKFP